VEIIKATYRVVTPMFISGADQSKAELRLPSIKGALRFWWRALAWGRLNGDLVKIRQEENELFGSTDKEFGQAGVLMKMKLVDSVDSFRESQDAKDWKIKDWQSYVGYGLVKTRKIREYIKPGLRFCICLSAKSQEDLQAIEKPLKALGLLGSLGGRSRKGWGSINLQSLEGAVNWSAPTTLKAYQNELDNLISNYEKPPIYTAFSSETKMELGKVQRSAEEAHKYLATIYKDAIRHGYNQREREQFGLPRQRNNQRRASPVFLHIHEISTNEFVPVAVFLPAQFLEKQTIPVGNDSKVKIFLDAVVNGGLK
jgi:CRISPR-associated protein Cmr1